MGEELLNDGLRKMIRAALLRLKFSYDLKRIKTEFEEKIPVDVEKSHRKIYVVIRTPRSTNCPMHSVVIEDKRAHEGTKEEVKVTHRTYRETDEIRPKKNQSSQSFYLGTSLRCSNFLRQIEKKKERNQETEMIGSMF